MTQLPSINSEWNCKTVDFTGSSWGIKANMQKFADGSLRFTFPLMVTEVVKESQAALAGLRVFDHIVAYKRKNCSDFVSVTSNDINDDKGVVFVDKDVQSVLLEGGNCVLKIVSRNNNNLCKECQMPVIFHEEEGCLICHNCGVSVKTLCEYNYELIHYWNLFPKQTMESDFKYTCKNSKISHFRNVPTSISKSRSEIERICSHVNLCDSVNLRAQDFFEQYYTSKQMAHKKIRRIRGVVVACLLLAGQQLKISVNFNDIVRFMMGQDSTFYLKKQEVRRIKCEICSCLEIQVAVVPTRQLCDMLCVDLNLSILMAEEAQTMCDQVKNLNMSAGHVPSSISAASVFFVACHKRQLISLKTVSEHSGVAELTIKKTFQDCIQPILETE